MNNVERVRQTVEQLRHEHEAILIVCQTLDRETSRLTVSISRPVETDPDQLSRRIATLVQKRAELSEAVTIEHWLNQRLNKARMDLVEIERRERLIALQQIERDPQLTELVRRRDVLSGTPGDKARRELATVKREIEQRHNDLLSKHAAVVAG